jgi:hypothetical protein
MSGAMTVSASSNTAATTGSVSRSLASMLGY